MPKIKIIVSKFTESYARFNRVVDLDVSREQLMSAALTFGFQSYEEASISERAREHRIGVGRSSLAYLDCVDGFWQIDSEFHDIDGSEKGAISYWLGMILAKVVASSVMDIPWLAHADKLAKNRQLHREGTAKKGDFMGLDVSGEWHSIEAKGRSRRTEKGLVDNAKEQAESLMPTSPIQPVTASASIIKLYRKPIVVSLTDPPIDRVGDGSSGTFNWDVFASYYYSGLSQFIREFQSSSRGNEKFKDDFFSKLLPGYSFAPLGPIDVSNLELTLVGLPSAIVKNTKNAIGYFKKGFKSKHQNHSMSDYQLEVTSDGVAVVTIRPGINSSYGGLQ